METLKERLTKITEQAIRSRTGEDFEKKFMEAREELYDSIYKKTYDQAFLESEAEKGNYYAIIYSYKKNQEYKGIAVVKFFTPSGTDIKNILKKHKKTGIHIELKRSLMDQFDVIYEYDRKKERNYIKLAWGKHEENKKYDLTKFLID